MKLSKALNTFYYSTALCDLRLMNKQIVEPKRMVRGYGVVLYRRCRSICGVRNIEDALP